MEIIKIEYKKPQASDNEKIDTSKFLRRCTYCNQYRLVDGGSYYDGGCWLNENSWVCKECFYRWK